MSAIDLSTPILVGAGQIIDRLGDPAYRQLSPTDLAAEAATLALLDSGLDAALASQVDAIFAVRTVADSVPSMMRAQRAPFGTPENVPAAIAARIGATARILVYSPACGDEPQKLVSEICERLHAGELRMALVCGAEAESTQRAVQAAGNKLDWSEACEVQCDDRRGTNTLRTRHMGEHGLTMPTNIYPLLEHARRARLGESRESYSAQMGQLLSGFSDVASRNPFAASRKAQSASSITEVSESNRLIADPHTRAMVARDQVNLGAALLLTTVGTAQTLGIDQSRWVFLHGYSSADERPVLEREDLGASAAMAGCYRQALEAAGIELADVRYFDLYSCFPIAVFAALDSLGLQANDPRGLTLTGGLPFFGGPGNNYSMHALAEMIVCLRDDPGTYAMIGANGGFMSTHAVGVYSTRYKPFQSCDSSSLQARINTLPAPAFTTRPSGWGRVETYTVTYDKQGPRSIIVVGRLESSGERFIATSIESDANTLASFVAADGLGQRIFVRWHQGINRFASNLQLFEALIPRPGKQLLDHYEHVSVERRDHVLEVLINRPEVNNALIPEANDELAQIFDAFEADESLWIAVISGAGTKAFCTGNDLKATASGRRIWAPLTGFAGLTARPGRVKPVICAVNGYAMGGGFEIALACDLIVADESAQFALSEVRVGLIAGAGGLQRLTRQIPYKQAMDMILTGRRVGAAEGFSLGFINRVVPTGTALAGARLLAEQLLESSPTSIRFTKELLNDQSRHASEEDSVRQAYAATDKLVASDDFIEGITAFAQKRPPQWKNR